MVLMCATSIKTLDEQIQLNDEWIEKFEEKQNPKEYSQLEPFVFQLHIIKANVIIGLGKYEEAIEFCKLIRK